MTIDRVAKIDASAAGPFARSESAPCGRGQPRKAHRRFCRHLLEMLLAMALEMAIIAAVSAPPTTTAREPCC